RNRSHRSTSKTPSYTKSVSWQHHLLRHVFNIGEELNNIESWIYLRVTFSILVIKVLFPN
ncbi:hypothetical protein, partial [Escherichia coli]|uniref:hypothetical protein n=1 Tax=Escherichia coli TaxID=562 RepID=UPI00098C1815